ncbi:MAG: hypothetical protein JNL85_12875 [Rubrivivax sp.]|nr:hypothetical protein [Rubrivivax sp.]
MLLAAGLAWTLRPKDQAAGRVTVTAADVPVVMHTSGGRLEVATVTATELFRLDAPPRTFFGIDLGSTVSQVRVKVVYRYHIEMAKEWPIRFQGAGAVVEAGAVKPTLPVAFDTATLEKETRSGWGRFDKHQNLFELERRMTPELDRRSLGYQGLALEAARRSVGDFVRTWLVKERFWPAGTATTVQVVFPGEPLPAATTARPASAAVP